MYTSLQTSKTNVMRRQVILWGTPALLATLWVVSCKKDDNTTPQTNQTLQVTATLNGQSVRPVATGSTSTANFIGTIDPNSRVLTYTLTYSAGLVPISAYLYRITNLADSSGVADLALISGLSGGIIGGPGSGSSTTPGSGTSTTPGSGTSTTPGSGTATGPGSGTSTIPGSGTATDPGSGTSTTPGSGTSTTPGSGSSTTPGSGSSTTPGSGSSTTPGSGSSTTPGSGTSTGTGSTTITSPYTGSLTLTQAKIDSMRNGYYYISIGTNAFPGGEIRGRVRVQ